MNKWTIMHKRGTSNFRASLPLPLKSIPDQAKVHLALRPSQAGQATNDHSAGMGGSWTIKTENEHVLEQCGAATFLIEGISRACSHQLVRHRLASFGQESQRYVDMDKGSWQPVIPPAIQENKEAGQIYDYAWRTLRQSYRDLRELSIRKEDARFLLPNAAETRMVISVCPCTHGHTSAGSGRWIRPPSGR